MCAEARGGLAKGWQMLEEWCRAWQTVGRVIGYWVLGPATKLVLPKNHGVGSHAVSWSHRVGKWAHTPWQGIGHHKELFCVGGCRLSHPSVPSPATALSLGRSRSKCIPRPVLPGPGHCMLWLHIVVHVLLC